MNASTWHLRTCALSHLCTLALLHSRTFALSHFCTCTVGLRVPRVVSGSAFLSVAPGPFCDGHDRSAAQPLVAGSSTVDRYACVHCALFAGATHPGRGLAPPLMCSGSWFPSDGWVSGGSGARAPGHIAKPRSGPDPQMALRNAVAMSIRAIFTAGKMDARKVAVNPMADAVITAFQLTRTSAT
jgi:hypothetical protein